MSASRLPSVSDVIRWYADAGMKPVVTIYYGARKVVVRPRSDNDSSEESCLEPADPLADDIRKAFGGE